MGDWRISTWGQEISLEYGKSLRDYDETNGRYRVYGSNGPIGWTDSALAPGPGVILGRKGAYRGVEYSPAPFFVIDTAYYVVPKSEIDIRWLYYAIKYHKLGEIDDGSPIPSTTRSAVYVRNLEIPPLVEQKAIAAVLGALDDKIELNQRMNATLEAMARAMFLSWFVDFDPVRAKLDGRHPTALDPATAALFPAYFQDSELGHIPAGWRVTTIDETCQAIFSGGTPSTKEATYWGGNIPWLSSGETRSTFIIDTEKTITKAGVENSSARVARAGCTVIAGAGQGHTRGQTSLLTFESYINQSVVALASNPEVSSDLFLFFDLARRYEEFRQLSDSHSSRGSLTTKLLAGVKCVLPPHELVIAFERAARPLASQITANLHQSRTLATLRDTLLPKLLSGELGVATEVFK
ncbi:MAG: restriction endonuclease subunit S [Steroidobacteraceae bacterium]